jgi:predicted RND superfamily exporter protein
MSPPRFDSFDRRSTAWFGRHRLWLVPLFAAVLVPAGVAATRLETDNSVERWLGERDPAMRKFQRFRREFDVRPQVTAVLEGLRPDDPRVERCAAAIDRSELVRRVLTPHRLCRDVGLPVRALEQTPFGRLLVPEGRSTALWIELTEGAAAESRETVERFRALAEGCEIPREALHLGGPPVIDAALDKWGGESLRTLLPAVIAVCGLSLWILVRSLRQTLALVATASASVVLTLAVMALWGERLNLLLTALPPLVGVLHLSIGIHLLHHFNACTPPLVKGGERELEYRNQQEDEPSIGRAIRATFPPSCLASVTTIIGMLSLLVVDLQPLRAFGLWGAVGVLVSLFVAYSLLPCLLTGSHRAQPLMPGDARPPLDRGALRRADPRRVHSRPEAGARPAGTAGDRRATGEANRRTPCRDQRARYSLVRRFLPCTMDLARREPLPPLCAGAFRTADPVREPAAGDRGHAQRRSR